MTIGFDFSKMYDNHEWKYMINSSEQHKILQGVLLFSETFQKNLFFKFNEEYIKTL